MGPSVKFVLAIIDSISKKKWGLIFFPQNWTRRGGGARGLRVCGCKKSRSSFLNISLRVEVQTVLSLPDHPFQRREWIYPFSPLYVYPPKAQALSTKKGMSMVSGKLWLLSDFISGWGDTQLDPEGSTDILQETLVPIVPNSNCVDNTADDASLIQSLIVCAGGAGTGPCKVGAKLIQF